MDFDPPEIDLMAGGSVKFTEECDDDSNSITARDNN